MKVDDSSNYDFRKRTKAFALEIIRLYSSLPKQNTEIQVCGKQLLRSGTSVAANFREAFRARSTAEFISKLEQCLQEADESQLWLELLKEGCNVTPEKIDILWQECDELIAIMVTWVKKSKGN
ncbi:MAG: four helix bundle protein [Kiritimatiellales bacterium]|nr:four helix bundle protein [Pontiella sp.]NNJ70088.1 four helix bundle protein [Kiritimatiellales bacterium]